VALGGDVNRFAGVLPPTVIARLIERQKLGNFGGTPMLDT
jgi:hypothetical protein